MTKKWVASFALIFLLACSKDDKVVEPLVSELLPGKWEFLGAEFVGCQEFESGNFITDFEYDDTPSETTVIEIILEDIELPNSELGPVTSQISINLLSGNMYVAGMYQWIEYGKIFENFDTYDLHEKEYIALLTKDRLIWATGCGFPFGIKRDFRRVIE